MHRRAMCKNRDTQEKTMMLKQPLAPSQSHVSSLFTHSSLRAAAMLPSGAAAAPRGRRRGSRGRLPPTISCSAADEAVGAIAFTVDKQVTVKATVTVKLTVGGLFSHVGLTHGLDDIADLRGRTLLLELISAELDSRTGLEKPRISSYAHRENQEADEAKYEASFTVPAGFGPVGAVAVENEHRNEMYLKDIVLVVGGGDSAAVTVDCNSWVHSKFDNPAKRVFFARKSYLPSQTPEGLERLRESELASIRGDGQGERKKFDRIYDYDVYNDLGNPDADPNLKRPVLGGEEHPYPRRCRTGRPRTKTDPLSEERSAIVYVPRDEMFSEVKNATFTVRTLRSALHAVMPSLETTFIDTKLGFPVFTAIDSLFNEGIKLPKQEGFDLSTVIPRLISAIEETTDNVLLFETPEMMNRDKFSWFRDEEFARQTLAGLNPVSIQLVTDGRGFENGGSKLRLNTDNQTKEFPPVSKLDPEVYGSPESLITKEIIEEHIKGVMTVEEAVEQKRLFMLDYHDIYLPYVHKVRELDDTTLYGSRTLFFLTNDGTLRPIAIELTRPNSPTKPQWKKVFTHCWDATGSWLWKLAKAHVLAHDAGYHQLVSHWLRTHCCVEPYIIAANRQLSAMHPIYRLLHPHFRYTMEINALAREYLINASGIIETTFSPGKYSIELSSVAYDKSWRFDMEALPADLIRRGMAVEENGELKLTIEDYPYANDGLLIWNSIKEWASDYVAHYYRTAEDIMDDEELQGWWTEVRTVGHGDKKDEPWWPVLDSHENLVQVLTTIMWVASGHHAAVNFGQYHYGGYFPNRPTIIRKNMPVEDNNEEDLKTFWNKPEDMLLEFFPSQIQASFVMTVLDILSSHSPDEEYMGEHMEPSWKAEPLINAAFEKFSGRMREIEGIIDQRNANMDLMNRCGAGIVPYELLKPFSKPGVTGRGIPNSISI